MEFISGILVGVAAWPAFWLLFVILSAILSASIVNESGGWSTLFTISLGVMIAAKWQAIVSNPMLMIVGIVGYLVLGILWSRFKWSRFLSRQFDNFTDIRDSYLRKANLSKDYLKTATKDQLDEYKAQFTHIYGNSMNGDQHATTLTSFHASLAPKASSNKGSIVMWIMYWPVTAVWYIVADIVTDICKGLYNMVGGHFQKMSDEKFNQL